MPVVKGDATNPAEAGVTGTSAQFDGVLGITRHKDHAGVAGVNDQGGNGVYGKGFNGVYGHASGATGATGSGVVATSDNGTGLWAAAENGEAVHAHSNSPNVAALAAFNVNVNGGSAAVYGEHKGNGPAGLFISANGEAVRGNTNSPDVAAIAAYNANVNGGSAALHSEHKGKGPAGLFISENGEAVHGRTNSPNVAAIAAYNANVNGGSAALYAEHKGKGPAAFFRGNVVVTGDLFLEGADLAEHFELADGADIEPGTVVVLDGVDRIRISESPYDRRVAGVVSGAGSYRPGIMLDHHESAVGRHPLALVGKVFCKVDAGYASIGIGDVLTTSATPGHAMKATKRRRTFGAVLGKAMAPLDRGTGLLPILVTLQ